MSMSMSAPMVRNQGFLMQLLILLLLLIAVPAQLLAQESAVGFDVLIRNGTVYDGSGGAGLRADVGIKGDRIAAIGDLAGAEAAAVIDANGLAVAPGFINMLSWSTASLLVDGRSQSEIHQGVTTEIMGEGASMGPLTDEMKQRTLSRQGDLKFEITWTTLSEYLDQLEKRGVSPNVASFIGSGTIREYVMGLQNRRPTADEMTHMCEVVRREMEGGALGIGSALLYTPDAYNATDDLIKMCRVAATYGGIYISHMRSEGERLIESVNDLIRISSEADIPAEIYHMKAGGAANWNKMDRVIAMINAARRRGLSISANIYLYTATSNRLTSRIPAWAQEGGDEALVKRLQDRVVREKVASEMRGRGHFPKTILIGFESKRLRQLTGKTLEEIALMHGKDEVETLLDTVIEDNAFTRIVSFTINEKNIAKELKQPWVSLGSDAASIASEGVFIKSLTHPRAYGNFARLFGKYVREEKVLSLPEAVRRVTGLPASHIGLDHRGLIREGYFADVVVFDPEKFTDLATFDDPHRYATGMNHVFVNGVQVLKDGDHTGAKPGRALKGPGWKPGKTEGAGASIID